MIQRIQSNETSFKAGRANFCMISDSHGKIMRIPRFLKTIENNAKDIFTKAGSPSTKNFFMIAGDWFINPSKKGFVTHPELSNGDLQNLALLRTIDAIKRIVRETGSKDAKTEKPAGLDVLYTMGNHCLDGGTKFMLDVMKKNPMKTLITNVNLEKSPAIVDAMGANDKIVKSARYEIPDDKNPNLKHHLLVLGVTIPSMDFYNPGLCDGLEFYDNSTKKDANINEEDLQGTIAAVKKEVEAFKAEHEKGAVVLMSHMGARLSEIVQKNVPQINHILNGHDHKNVQSNIGNTSINSLGQDFELLKALNIEFNDDGDLVKSTMTPYFPETTLADGLEKHPFQIFLNDYFKDDVEPLVGLRELKEEKEEIASDNELQEQINEVLNKYGIVGKNRDKLMKNESFREMITAEATNALEEEASVARGISALDYGNEIRYKNSYLMNYLTSALKRDIREKHDPEVFTVALQSSIVRGGLKDGADNLSLMKIFDGVSEDLSNLKIGNVKGEELVGLITENILANLKAPTRNTIIHWSDVQVNRTLIEAIKNGQSDASYAEAIRVRNKVTKQFEPIDLQEDYKMVIGEKFLVKDDIEWPGKIRDRFESLDVTYDQVFRDYISSVDYNLYITPKTKEQRIL